MWKARLDDAGNRFEEDLSEGSVVSDHTRYKVMVLRKVFCQVLECMLRGLQLARSCLVVVSDCQDRLLRCVLVLGAESLLIFCALLVTVTVTPLPMPPSPASSSSSTLPSLRFLVGRALPGLIALLAQQNGVDAIEGSASPMPCS